MPCRNVTKHIFYAKKIYFIYKSHLPVYCLREKENDVMYKGEM